jgi:histidine ammonia-lyase
MVRVNMSRRLVLVIMAALWVSCYGTSAQAADAVFHPIAPSMADKVVTLTGQDLTVEQVVEVARYGAKVQLSLEARQRAEDTYGLLLEGATEGVQIYLFNRAAGAGRQISTFTGDPMSPENLPNLKARSLQAFRNGANRGYGAEVSEEEIVRAMMVVRANQMTYLPASPQVMQMQLDLLNHRITPVVWSRGGTGEALGPAASNINATMVGAGDAYLSGVRMSAADALAKAGLKAIEPGPGDDTLYTVNCDVTGMSALLVYDARRLLDWIDLTHAMDMNGMNTNPTRLFGVAQANRPFPWLVWQTGRLRDMLRGSYLFEDDPTRIINDPESMETSVREGSAWEDWGLLRDDVTIQMNWSDHAPAVVVGAGPEDAWELGTPQGMKYFVKGGPESHGKHGYILSDTNWDPYPLSNRLESFTIALSNLSVAVMLRQERFTNTFFTTVKAEDFLPAGARGGQGAHMWSNHEVYQRIQGLINPVPPEGYGDVPQMVEDLDAETLFKVARAMQAVDETWMLVASDFANAAKWMDVRKLQNPSRSFGAAPTAAWQSFRQVSPLVPAAGAPAAPMAALTFLKDHPASSFISGGPLMPGSDAPLRRQNPPLWNKDPY